MAIGLLENTMFGLPTSLSTLLVLLILSLPGVGFNCLRDRTYSKTSQEAVVRAQFVVAYPFVAIYVVAIEPVINWIKQRHTPRIISVAFLAI